MGTPGCKLTAGERAKNWASAAVTIWPVLAAIVGLLGYTNKDHIQEWVGLSPADGITEVGGGQGFETDVKKWTEEMLVRVAALEAGLKEISENTSNRDRRDSAASDAAHEDLQQQIDEIKELVN